MESISTSANREYDRLELAVMEILLKLAQRELRVKRILEGKKGAVEPPSPV
jgi:hypothetical protein